MSNSRSTIKGAKMAGLVVHILELQDLQYVINFIVNLIVQPFNPYIVKVWIIFIFWVRYRVYSFKTIRG